MAEVTTEDRSRAMASVYFHGYPELQERLLISIRKPYPTAVPIPLDSATRILLADEEHSAPLRLRRAIVKLAAGRMLAGNDRQREDLRVALVTLGAPIQRIDAIPALDRPLFEIEVLRLLVLSNFSAQCPNMSHTDVAFDPVTYSTIAYFSIKINRAFNDIARVVDPLNWAACSPYFRASYVAQQLSGGNYPRSADGDAIKNAMQPAPGSTWKGVMFEHFRFADAFGFEGYFRNLLHIDAIRSNDEFHYYYSLRESINSGYGPLIKLPVGGLARDDGFLGGKLQADGTTVVTGVKVLQTSFGLTDSFAQFALRPMADELADVLCSCNPP